jgi:hypothetical protein
MGFHGMALCRTLLFGMTPALNLEILDLRHFSASNLKPVLEAESVVWNQRLRWDFHASANLLLQYLDSRLLPGYVAIENGRICGYVFCVYESEKALVGDVFAVPSADHPELTADVERRLLEHMIELLQHSPGVERIESQLLLRPHGTHTDTLRNAGFEIYERLFMELELGSANLDEGPPAGRMSELELRSWKDSDFSAAGHLIAHAYEAIWMASSTISTARFPVLCDFCITLSASRVVGCSILPPHASWRTAAATRSRRCCSARGYAKMWGT